MTNREMTSKIQSIMSSIIDFIDVFGQLPSLRVLKKEKQKSSVGFLMTTLLMGATITYLTTEIISMLQKSQPSMIASEELIFDTSAFELNNNNFTLALSVADINGDSIEGLNKYYTLQIQQCTRIRIEDQKTGNITIQKDCIDLPYETCNMSHFLTDLQQNYFKRIKLGSLQCINRKFLNDSPPVLKGQINSMEFQFILIHLKICKNTTESQTCASKEEILTSLESAQYNIYSSDYLLQLARAKDPLEQIITPYFVSFSTSTSKKILQYYEIVQTTSDDGLLFEQLQSQANLKKGQFEPYSELYNGKYLIQHYIAIQSVQTNYFRSYIKLQTILAKIGGIWQIFLLVFSFLFKGLLYDLMLLKVSNKLFHFTETYSQDLNSSRLKSERNFDSTLFVGYKFPNSFFSSIKIILGCDNKKSKQFKKAKFEILQSLDIVNILKKLQRVELFIRILTNERQFQALMAISKPHIIYSEKEILHAKHQYNENKLTRLYGQSSQKIRKYDYNHFSMLFRDLKESQAFGFENEINQKLISIIEKNFPNFKCATELQSPISQKGDELRMIDIVDDILEPKVQKMR